MASHTAMSAQQRSAGDPASQSLLDFYRQPSEFTSAGHHAALFDNLPNDAESLGRIVQGLVLHKYMASAYGVDVPAAREAESHLRRAEQMLDRIIALDSRALLSARAPAQRLFGVCGHFTVLLVAMLRAKGTPARARAGFGAYFNAPYFEEHVLCEYWSADEARWMLLDTQFDEVWKKELKIAHDPFDVPRDLFLTASDAWTLCRTGKADPNLFGIFNGNLRGLWFVAAELIRDIAALNKAEVLVWDVWGAMPKPDTQLDAEQLAFFDHLATLTRYPDAEFSELRALYRNNERVRLPAVVFNAVRNRPETV